MSHQPLQLLQQWQQLPTQQWVLGWVYHTQGSAYRKAGALMLFSDCGKQLGLLSGGCLESDLQRRAMQVLASGKPQQVVYDSQDEDDVTYQLGIGCGGVVSVQLAPLTTANQQLALPALMAALQDGHHCYLRLRLGDNPQAELTVLSQPCDSTKAQLDCRGDWLTIPVSPPPQLAIFGAGVDALPLYHIATQLGWLVTLVDPRPSHGRPDQFVKPHRLVKARPADIAEASWLHQIDAVVIMHHQIELDAEAAALWAVRPPRYGALLGPSHRRDQVLQQAGVTTAPWLAGPAGLSLGGELPESVALSIIAECHAKLFGGNGQSLSAVLNE
ncbi:XdhC family protein [Ferrimonas senticii]|uniref:XdhC family protein n=1 Tax=Ferrimonas senticii TaxID=394566 RepID=UPI0004834112|nr:XdhC/CoxI family protein [Ferrimonas senticii]